MMMVRVVQNYSTDSEDSFIQLYMGYVMKEQILRNMSNMQDWWYKTIDMNRPTKLTNECARIVKKSKSNRSKINLAR